MLNIKMQKQMKTISPIIFLLSVVIVFFGSACTNDKITDEECEPAVINVLFDNLKIEGGEFSSEESTVTKVRIYVFSGNRVDAMKIFNSGEETFKSPFRLQTTTGMKTVYVIANEPAALTTSLDAVKTLNALKEITDTSKSPLKAPLTMVGSASVDVKYAPDPANNSQVTVELIRIASNLRLQVKKDESTKADIIMRAVRLLRIPEKSVLIEGEPVSGQAYWDYTYTGNGATPVTTGGVDVWTGATEMYIYENPGSVSDTINRATYLVIDATYNGVDTRYRAYINDDNSDATDHKYSTKRNHQYNIIATINNIGEFDGLTLSTYVTPWSLLKSEWLFERVFAIKPHPTVDEQIYTALNPDNSITFTFLLHNPVGAKWTAQLSNPFYFEFSNEGSAVSRGEVGTEYTISIKPRLPQSAELRSTEFYIIVGVDGDGDSVEIPLIKGSTLVGPGNRIVINQPAVTP